MTNLDDLTQIGEIDAEGMLEHVAALPEQCRAAWRMTRHLQLPAAARQARQVVIAGMGGSAIGGDLAVAVAAGRGAMPIRVHRDYDLPLYADEGTLVIASSYSGGTEETLSAFQAAQQRGCPVVAITTGGELARLAREKQVPLISFDYKSQPRAALGYMFVSVLAVLEAIGATGDLEADVGEAVSLLEARRTLLGPESPHAQNQAKQVAVYISGRVPVIVAAGPLAPVARRWKTQCNENGKNLAYFEELPEMDHNALAGTHFPAEMREKIGFLFLNGEGADERRRSRLEYTRQIFEEQGLHCLEIVVPGSSVLAQMLAAIQLGDYASCYLALLNDTNPTTIDDIAGLKLRMAGGRGEL